MECYFCGEYAEDTVELLADIPYDVCLQCRDASEGLTPGEYISLAIRVAVRHRAQG